MQPRRARGDNKACVAQSAARGGQRPLLLDPTLRAGGPRRLVHTKQNKSASQRNFFIKTTSIYLVKVPLRGTWQVESQDQAACIFDALAWSYEQNRVFDPLCIFDA